MKPIAPCEWQQEAREAIIEPSPTRVNYMITLMSKKEEFRGNNLIMPRQMEYLKVLPSAWGGAARACAFINPYILYESLQILTTFQIRMTNLIFLVKYIKQDLCIGTMGTCDG